MSWNYIELMGLKARAAMPSHIIFVQRRRSEMYWCVYVILALWSQRQENCCKFEASVVNRKKKKKAGLNWEKKAGLNWDRMILFCAL